MNDKIKIIYMGSPEFSADILENIYKNDKVDIVSIYTRPDSINRRGNNTYPSPVAERVKKLDMKCPVNKITSLRDESVIEDLRRLDFDYICVAAFGLILPEEVLYIKRNRCLNVHASLLPKGRGAAPLMRAVLEGDEFVGFSIMRMVKEMDEGDFCNQTKYPAYGLSVDDLFKKMAPDAANKLILTMQQDIEGKANWISQDSCNEKPTYANKIDKRELNLQNSDSQLDAYRKVLASCDSAPCKCVIWKWLVTLKNVIPANDVQVKPNEAALISGKLYIGMTDGALEIKELVPAGKRLMDGKSFALGIQDIKNNPIL